MLGRSFVADILNGQVADIKALVQALENELDGKSDEDNARKLIEDIKTRYRLNKTEKGTEFLQSWRRTRTNEKVRQMRAHISGRRKTVHTAIRCRQKRGKGRRDRY